MKSNDSKFRPIHPSESDLLASLASFKPTNAEAQANTLALFESLLAIAGLGHRLDSAVTFSLVGLTVILRPLNPPRNRFDHSGSKS
jgi:hypothetical protein